MRFCRNIVALMFTYVGNKILNFLLINLSSDMNSSKPEEARKCLLKISRYLYSSSLLASSLETLNFEFINKEKS